GAVVMLGESVDTPVEPLAHWLPHRAVETRNVVHAGDRRCVEVAADGEGGLAGLLEGNDGAHIPRPGTSPDRAPFVAGPDGNAAGVSERTGAIEDAPGVDLRPRAEINAPQRRRLAVEAIIELRPRA